MIVVLCDPETGEPVTDADSEDSCRQYGGDLCGGCGTCIIAQGVHYGLIPRSEEYVTGWEFGRRIPGRAP